MRTPEQLLGYWAELGRKLARGFFEKRGNHSEVHLSEMVLASLLALAAELAVKQAAVEAFRLGEADTYRAFADYVVELAERPFSKE